LGADAPPLASAAPHPASRCPPVATSTDSLDTWPMPGVDPHAPRILGTADPSRWVLDRRLAATRIVAGDTAPVTTRRWRVTARPAVMTECVAPWIAP
jgi:hypothetical protein